MKGVQGWKTKKEFLQKRVRCSTLLRRCDTNTLCIHLCKCSRVWIGVPTEHGTAWLEHRGMRARRNATEESALSWGAAGKSSPEAALHLCPAGQTVLQNGLSWKGPYCLNAVLLPHYTCIKPGNKRQESSRIGNGRKIRGKNVGS